MTTSPYNKQRRVKNRRETADRRQDIRFEPGKKDRRENPGRRAGDRDAWHGHET